MQRWINAQQDDAGALPTAPKHQITEIFVFGQQKPIILLRPPHDRGVVLCRRDLRHVNNIVAISPKPCNQPGIHAFVGEPAHG